MGLGRRRPQPDATVEPPALRRRRSLRNETHQIKNREMLFENDVESDPDSAIQNLITGRMRECKINLTQAKVLQTQCWNVQESSDPVVHIYTLFRTIYLYVSTTTHYTSGVSVWDWLANDGPAHDHFHRRRQHE
ncbi:unnamed protein product [Heligmosomoides polygyrus]|uniref:Uncharacterized protein n=1 Tax=Heligmosomoides polygyrus TaxID=6339 RepID=A0A183F2C0_HELPZ|nr:unnamed protein product [Heligmosomoides polygyrus]